MARFGVARAHPSVQAPVFWDDDRLPLRDTYQQENLQMADIGPQERIGPRRFEVYVCPVCGSMNERPTVTGKCRGFLNGPTHKGAPAVQERLTVVEVIFDERKTDG